MSTLRNSLRRSTNSPRAIRLQELLGESVYDTNERKLGSVRDVMAQKWGDALRIEALLIGKGAWLTRLGWTADRHGTEVPWTDVIQLTPRIVVRPQDHGG